MPAYVLDFLSGDGPQRRRYTLDDEYPLRSQLEHVLADLERGGVVLQGGPTDELAVYWAGRELDAAEPPRALGISSDRPLELRMQRRRPTVTLPAPVPESAPEAFTPRGVYAGATLGLTAGALAWAAAAVLTDRGPLLDRAARLDGVAALLWGTLVGAGVLAAHARRLGVSAWRGLFVGGAAGLLAAAAWTAARQAAAGPERVADTVVSPLWRVGLWAALTALVAVVLAGAARLRPVRATAAPDPTPPGAALMRAGGWALLAGAGAGALGLLPGEAALWQALAAALAGAGVGGATAWAGVRAAPAVFELETDGERPVGVATLREWALPGNATVYLRRGAAAAGGAAAIVGEQGRYRLYADAGSRAARELRHDDRLTLGNARYRFRRRVIA